MTEEHLFTVGKQFRPIELKALATKGSLTRCANAVRTRFYRRHAAKEGSEEERVKETRV